MPEIQIEDVTSGKLVAMLMGVTEAIIHPKDLQVELLDKHSFSITQVVGNSAVKQFIVRIEEEPL
jgi:hypothetical protein